MKTQNAAKGKSGSKNQTTKNQSQMKTAGTKTHSKPVIETAAKDKLVMLSPSVLTANPKNPRIKYEEIEELMHSILENGLIDPLTGYYKDGNVILKDGHRRKRAIDLAIAKGNKIEKVPVLIVAAPTEEQETLDYILHNDGKPLSMLEQSEVIKRLINFGWKVTDVVKKTGKARGYIENLIILTKLPMKVYNLIVEDKISAHAVIQIVAAVKGDDAKLIAAVEEAISAANAAGKSKATPKHVKNEKVKGQSFGKFYKWIEEIADFIAGRKDLHAEKAAVITDMLMAFENGQRPKEVAERYFLDKAKKDLAPKAEPVKTEAPKSTPAPVKAAAKKAPAKAAPKKAAPKKAAKKATGKKK